MRATTAELWLGAWGEIMRCRHGCIVERPSGERDDHGKQVFEQAYVPGGSLGRGIGEGGRYRPEDDPHPSSWVVAQVERVLMQMGPSEKRVAEVVYLRQRSLFSLRHEMGSHRQARNAQKRLLEAVNDAVVRMKERTIAEAQAKALIEAGHFDGPGWTQVVEWLADRADHRYPVTA